MDQFEAIVKNLELSAKKVRKKLIDQWIQEELDNRGDPVARLQWLRTSTTEQNVWPCHCGNIGEGPLFFAKLCQVTAQSDLV